MNRPKSLAQLNEEYAQAKLAKQQMDHAVQSVFTTITKTGTVNPQQAAEAVQEITIAMRTLTDSAHFHGIEPTPRPETPHSADMRWPPVHCHW